MKNWIKFSPFLLLLFSFLFSLLNSVIFSHFCSYCPLLVFVVSFGDIRIFILTSSPSPSHASYARKQLENLSSMVCGLWSNDNKLQLEATTQFCKLSIEQKPPIEAVIQSGVVPQFVEFLMREDFPQLQFEAAWALANIASGTSEGTEVVIDNRALPIFIKLLGSPNADVREQAVFALGIVAGDSPTCRDHVLGHEALVPLLEQLKEDAKISMLRNATWTLSNFCKGEPQPFFEMVSFMTMWWWWWWCVVRECQFMLLCLSAGVCSRLVKLLLHHSSSVVFPALQTIGNIVTGDDTQTQVILESGALEYLLRLLTDNPDKSIKKEACFAISNITAGNNDQIQAVIEAQVIGPLVELLQTAEFDIKEYAARAIFNVCYDRSREPIKYLVSEGCINPLCDLLLSPDPENMSLISEDMSLISAESCEDLGSCMCYEDSEDLNLIGTSIIALKYNNGVMLASESRSTFVDFGNAVEGDNTLKLHYICDMIFVAGSGGSNVNLMTLKTANTRFATVHPDSVRKVAEFIAREREKVVGVSKYIVVGRLNRERRSKIFLVCVVKKRSRNSQIKPSKDDDADVIHHKYTVIEKDIAYGGSGQQYLENYIESDVDYKVVKRGRDYDARNVIRMAMREARAYDFCSDGPIRLVCISNIGASYYEAYPINETDSESGYREWTDGNFVPHNL